MFHGPSHAFDYATDTCLEWGLMKKFHINYNQGSTNQIPYLLDHYHPWVPRPHPPSMPPGKSLCTTDGHYSMRRTTKSYRISFDRQQCMKENPFFTLCSVALLFFFNSELSLPCSLSVRHKVFRYFLHKESVLWQLNKRKHGFKTKRIPKEKSNITTHLGTQQSGKMFIW